MYKKKFGIIALINRLPGLNDSDNKGDQLWEKRSNAQNAGAPLSLNIPLWETWKKKRSTGVWSAVKNFRRRSNN